MKTHRTFFKVRLLVLATAFLAAGGCTTYTTAGPGGAVVVSSRPAYYGPSPVIYGSSGVYRGAYVAGGPNVAYGRTAAGGVAYRAGDSGRAYSARGGSAQWNNGSGSASGWRGGSADWDNGSGSASTWRGGSANWNNGSGSASGARGGSANWGGGGGSWDSARGRSGSFRR